MTQEDKQLLIKDLCARLPYGIHCLCNNGDRPLTISYINKEKVHIEEYPQPKYDITDVKPYIRPMSSMTKEEKYTYRHMLGAQLNSEGVSIMFVYIEDFPVVIDWLNAHHFDYRGLIEKGLALEAPEDMYKTE